MESRRDDDADAGPEEESQRRFSAVCEEIFTESQRHQAAIRKDPPTPSRCLEARGSSQRPSMESCPGALELDEREEAQDGQTAENRPVGCLAATQRILVERTKALVYAMVQFHFLGPRVGARAPLAHTDTDAQADWVLADSQLVHANLESQQRWMLCVRMGVLFILGFALVLVYAAIYTAAIGFHLNPYVMLGCIAACLLFFPFVFVAKKVPRLISFATAYSSYIAFLCLVEVGASLSCYLCFGGGGQDGLQTVIFSCVPSSVALFIFPSNPLRNTAFMHGVRTLAVVIVCLVDQAHLSSTGQRLISDGTVPWVHRVVALVVTEVVAPFQILVFFRYAFSGFEQNMMATQQLRLENHGQHAATDNLIYSLIPPQKATNLRLTNPRSWFMSCSDFIENVSVLQIDIKGFTALSSMITARKLLDLVNSIFTSIDGAAECIGHVWKAETIGDCYRAVCGDFTPSKKNPWAKDRGRSVQDHADRALALACSIIIIVNGIAEKLGLQEVLSVRCGVASGSITAAVMGKDLPRYLIFGPTCQTANSMEEKAQAGCVLLAADTAKLLATKGWRMDDASVDGEDENPLECYSVALSALNRKCMFAGEWGLQLEQILSIFRQQSPNGPVPLCEEGSPTLLPQSASLRALSSAPIVERPRAGIEPEASEGAVLPQSPMFPSINSRQGSARRLEPLEGASTEQPGLSRVGSAPGPQLGSVHTWAWQHVIRSSSTGLQLRAPLESVDEDFLRHSRSSSAVRLLGHTAMSDMDFGGGAGDSKLSLRGSGLQEGSRRGLLSSDEGSREIWGGSGGEGRDQDNGSSYSKSAQPSVLPAPQGPEKTPARPRSISQTPALKNSPSPGSMVVPTPTPSEAPSSAIDSWKGLAPSTDKEINLVTSTTRRRSSVFSGSHPSHPNLQQHSKPGSHKRQNSRKSQSFWEEGKDERRVRVFEHLQVAMGVSILVTISVAALANVVIIAVFSPSPIYALAPGIAFLISLILLVFYACFRGMMRSQRARFLVTGFVFVACFGFLGDHTTQCLQAGALWPFFGVLFNGAGGGRILKLSVYVWLMFVIGLHAWTANQDLVEGREVGTPSEWWRFLVNFISQIACSTMFLMPLALVMVQLRKFADEQHEALQGIQQEIKKQRELLSVLVPSSISMRLQQGETRIADRHYETTVMFVYIPDFGEMMAGHGVTATIQWVNAVFGALDDAVEAHNQAYPHGARVEKVESFNNFFMAVCGCGENERHAELSVLCAARMVQMTSKVKQPNGKMTSLKVGMNSGPLCAGVIGLASPRYSIFGDTVNVGSRMASSSEPSQNQHVFIHVSGTTAERLDSLLLEKEHGLKLKMRGERTVKGKGQMMTWFVSNEVSFSL